MAGRMVDCNARAARGRVRWSILVYRMYVFEMVSVKEIVVMVVRILEGIEDR